MLYDVYPARHAGSFLIGGMGRELHPMRRMQKSVVVSGSMRRRYCVWSQRPSR